MAIGSPSPPQPAAPAPEPAADAEQWMVQLGSFGDEDNARRLANRVSTFGFNARVSTFETNSGPMYRVRVGPESTRGSAEAVASSLTAHGFVAQVVTLD